MPRVDQPRNWIDTHHKQHSRFTSCFVEWDTVCVGEIEKDKHRKQWQRPGSQRYVTGTLESRACINSGPPPCQNNNQQTTTNSLSKAVQTAVALWSQLTGAGPLQAATTCHWLQPRPQQYSRCHITILKRPRPRTSSDDCPEHATIPPVGECAFCHHEGLTHPPRSLRSIPSMTYC